MKTMATVGALALLAGATGALAGGALRLEGVGDWVRVDHVYAGPELTVEMRINSTLDCSGWSDDFMGIACCTNGSQSIWEANVDQAGCAVLTVNYGLPGTGGVNDGCTVEANVWTRLTMTYDSLGVARIYVDGELANSHALGAPLAPMTGGYLAIGLNPPVRDEWYVGLIDDLRIWNVARSAEQIAASDCPVAPGSPGLAGNWTFDEIGASTAHDSSLGGHDGALLGGAEIVALPTPTPDFSASATLVPRGASVQFTDLSSGEGIVGRRWSFGDGGSSEEPEPSHAYAAVGVYGVTLELLTECESVALTRSEYIVVEDVCESCWLHEDWESGTIDPVRWRSFGSPAPVLVAGACGSDWAFDANGDASYESGVASWQAFDLSQRPTVGFRAYSTAGGGMRSVRVAWAETTADAYNDPPDAPSSELAAISLIPQSGSEQIVYGIPGDSHVEAWDPAWNGVCQDFRMELNADGSVSFFRNGALVHRTALTIDLAAWSAQALVVFGRSEVGVDDVCVLPPVPEASQLALVEDWESGAIDPLVWKSFGSPAPEVWPLGHESPYSFHANGDGSYESGVASWTAFDMATLPEVSFWCRGSESGTPSSVHVAIALTTAEAYNDPPDAPGAELASIGLIPQAGYREITYGAMGDGFSEPWRPEWDDQWQHFVIRVNGDGTLSFYRNGYLRHRTAAPIDLHAWSEQALVIFGRSNMLVDDVVVTVGNAAPPAVVDLDIHAVAGGLAVELSWSPVPFATSYRVYRLPGQAAALDPEYLVSEQCTTTYVESVGIGDVVRLYRVVAVWE